MNEFYEITQIEKGFIVNEPGLRVINTVAKMRNNRTLPLLIVNNTQKVMKIYRHGLVAKIVKTTENKIKRVENISALPNV